MLGKPLPAPPEKWPEIVAQSLGLLADNGWILACTVISGLPGEDEKDVIKTLEMLDDIRDIRAFLVPMNFVAMGPSRLSKEDSFTVEKMTPAHWMLVGECLERDVRLSREFSSLLIGGNPLIKTMAMYAMNRFINGAESYARKMKDGYPPLDYSSLDSDYLIPQL